MDKHIVIVRHGHYDSGDAPLSSHGVEQIKRLREIIKTFVLEKAKEAGDERINAIFISFSFQKRAVESILGLRWVGYDVFMTDESNTERFDIRNPDEILRKVMRIADLYSADVAVIVAHGAMPSVITETASRCVTHKRIGLLPNVNEACGFVTNLVTGEVTSIRHKEIKSP